jgi:predicted DNA binding protein
MRELVFALEHEPGCNRVADVLAEHPDADIRSLSLHATAKSLWRVDHVTGPVDALSDIEDAFLAENYYTDCITSEHCDASQRTQVLESTDDMLIMYSYWERTSDCASVPHMALEYLGQGALFEATKQQREYVWRIVHSGEGDVRALLNDLEETVADCVSIDFRRLSDTSLPVESTATSDDLPTEEKEALQAVVEHGYCEAPREIDVGELAERLEVPRSTFNHRLRRAEEQLAKQRVASMNTRQQPPSPD